MSAHNWSEENRSYSKALSTYLHRIEDRARRATEAGQGNQTGELWMSAAPNENKKLKTHPPELLPPIARAADVLSNELLETLQSAGFRYYTHSIHNPFVLCT